MDKQEFIKRAVEWLDEFTSDYATFDDDYWENKKKFIDDFKQAMEINN